MESTETKGPPPPEPPILSTISVGAMLTFGAMQTGPFRMRVLRL
jgi:hypothetical protein